MNSEQASVAHECANLSAAGTIHFGEVVSRLKDAGIERYHADYSRMETTSYTPEGGSCAATMKHEPAAIDTAFSSAQVEAAVRRAQRGEVKYQEFTHLVLAAGCVGYFVHITGQNVLYMGRNGEVHTEWFPGAAGRISP